jgi:hypothetical protein
VEKEEEKEGGGGGGWRWGGRRGGVQIMNSGHLSRSDKGLLQYFWNTHKGLLKWGGVFFGGPLRRCCSPPPPPPRILH